MLKNAASLTFLLAARGEIAGEKYLTPTSNQINKFIKEKRNPPTLKIVDEPNENQTPTVENSKPKGNNPINENGFRNILSPEEEERRRVQNGQRKPNQRRKSVISHSMTYQEEVQHMLPQS